MDHPGLHCQRIGPSLGYGDPAVRYCSPGHSSRRAGRVAYLLSIGIMMWDERLVTDNQEPVQE